MCTFKTRAVLLIFTYLLRCVRTAQQLQIGGIFDKSEKNEELAFKFAVNKVNSYYLNTSFQLVGVSVFVQTGNTFAVSKATCQLLKKGVVGVFGPSSPVSSKHVQSLCDSKEIPHIEMHWDRNQQRSLVNLFPEPSVLVKVYVDIVDRWNWTRFTVLYDDETSLSKINELLMHNSRSVVITVKQIVVDSALSYRTLLNDIKNSGDTHFIIDCSVRVLEEVLIQAQQVGIIMEKYNFLVTNLDMHTINLAPFQYGGCNITGVRMINPEHNDMIDVAENLQKMKTLTGHRIKVGHLAAWSINLKTALLIDAVSIFYETLKEFGNTKKFEAKSMLCNSSVNWEHGYSIINYLKTKNYAGLTGLVKFDNHGLRSEFVLDILELKAGGLTKIGIWNSTSGINITRLHKSDETSENDEATLQNKTFVVITALTPPYGLLKETTTKLSGNERFEGYGIDLIHELSLMLGFNYTFVIQEDGANGNYNRSTKQWNGMIREIIDGRADLAITDLTITSERENAVDFTMPFMNLGISILYRKPEPVPPSLFTFASPFSFQVWMMLGVAYFSVSLCLFFIGRLCPSEWTNPFPCVQEPEYLINQFTLRNSLWFTIGSFMQQGTEIAPIGMSTRMVAGVWWFFTLIMVSSYTANLAAFLTVETLVTPFKNIDDLARQTDINYGAKSDGATSNFFRDSDIDSYKTIWNHMYRHQQDMTADNDEGLRRVKSENYAFLMESTTIEYIVERHCSLAQVGGLLDDKGYGIAMRKGFTLYKISNFQDIDYCCRPKTFNADSLYRHILSAAVVKLQENGKLTSLKIKWWKEKHGGGNCNSQNQAGEATPLGLKNVEGVFFILLFGTILGFSGTFLELALHVLKKNYKDRSKFLKEYMDELRFIFKFKKGNKPIRIGSSSRDSSDFPDSQISET